LGNSLYFPLGAGACAWIDGDRPSPSQAAGACVEGGVTVMFGVPTFWAHLARDVADGRVVRDAFAGVRLAVSAGEPLSEAVFDAVRRHVGLELVDGLGSSEATNLYLSNRPGRAIRGSVGRVVPGFEVRVCDVDDRRLTPGEVGQLLVRGGSIMAGYLGDEAAMARTLASGWLHTGDLVQRRGDGAYRFVRRVGDRFKSGGLWVNPYRVAAVLAEHRRVVEVTVLGLPDQVGVVRVVAVVAAIDGVDGRLEQDLATLAASRLAPHEVPRTFAIVPELPTTPSGRSGATRRPSSPPRRSPGGRALPPDHADLLATWNRCGCCRLVGWRCSAPTTTAASFGSISTTGTCRRTAPRTAGFWRASSTRRWASRYSPGSRVRAVPPLSSK